MTARRKHDGRATIRKEIKDAATAARVDLLNVGDLATRVTREEYGADGRRTRVAISLEGQLNLNRAALLHLQSADSHFETIRIKLTKQRERLETAHERELVFGPEAEAKPKRLTRQQKRERVTELVNQASEDAFTTTWGRKVTFNRIGREVGVTGETARKWIREAEETSE